MESYLNGLRAGMNELFTDFKKQFEKLQTSNKSKVEEEKSDEDAKDNYQVSIMYDNYYIRKMEITENVLMIAICDMQDDGLEDPAAD